MSWSASFFVMASPPHTLSTILTARVVNGKPSLRTLASSPGVFTTPRACCRFCVPKAALLAFDRSTIGDVLERLEAKGLLRETQAQRISV